MNGNTHPTANHGQNFRPILLAKMAVKKGIITRKIRRGRPRMTASGITLIYAKWLNYKEAGSNGVRHQLSGICEFKYVPTKLNLFLFYKG